jgi:hypothetical protein
LLPAGRIKSIASPLDQLVQLEGQAYVDVITAAASTTVAIACIFFVITRAAIIAFVAIAFKFVDALFRQEVTS